MIKNIYSFYNRKISAYGLPVFHTEDADDMVQVVSRDFLASEPDAQVKLAEHLLYYLGTFDDVTCTFNLVTPNVILDLGSLVNKKEA